MHAQSVTAFCISAISGGGGKTMLSIGLARALNDDGYLVKPFKKGPDYIDAAWLSAAAGVDATNLDLFFLSGEKLRVFFQSSLASCLAGIKTGDASPNVLALVEGNRGLFDGLDMDGSCSTSALCRTLHLPVLLCLDCTKMTRTIAAVVRGITSFEPVSFCGIVLNRVGSKRHERALMDAMSLYTDVPVIGALPRLRTNPLPERHMGIAFQQVDEREKKIAGLSEFVRQHVDLHKLTGFVEEGRKESEACPHESRAEKGWADEHCPAHLHDVYPMRTREPQSSFRPRIGFVRDEAIWFYYPENLKALEQAGASLVGLSILGTDRHNVDAWQSLDGVYLGGGFPEDYAQNLNRDILAILASHAEKGMPVYAECGGMVILGEELETPSGKWPMAGFLPFKIRWTEKPQGLGYVSGTVVRENPFFPAGILLRGHEFHYSRCSTNIQRDRFALRLQRGVGFGPMMDEPAQNADACAANFDGIVKLNTWASWMHIFAPAIPGWANSFVKLTSVFAETSRRAG